MAVAGAAYAEVPPADDTFSLGTVEIIGHRIAADTAVTTETVNAEALADRHPHSQTGVRAGNRDRREPHDP